MRKISILTSAIAMLTIANVAFATAPSDIGSDGDIITIEEGLNQYKTYTTTKMDSLLSTAEQNAKDYADGLATNYDAAGAAATAEQNAKDYADGLATNYDAAGAAATAEQNAKDYADGLATNYDAAGAAATAEQNAKDYADGLATNYDAAGAAASAEQNAKSYTDDLANGAVKTNTNAIAEEATERANADSALNTKISDETTRAMTAENALDTKISNETTRAMTAENALDTKISNETTRAMTAENAINAKIGDMSTLNAGTGSVGNALSNGSGAKPTTVVAALNNVDATLGQIHGLKNGNSHLKADSNLANGTTVEQHLVALDDAIGNRNAYSNTNTVNYGEIADNTTVVDAVSQVASNIGGVVSATNGNIVATNTVNANLDALDTAIGSRQYADTTVAYGQSTANTNLTAAVSQVASNIGGAIDSVQSRDTGAISATNTVNDNIKALDTAIGANVTNTYNNVATTNSVNQNIDAVNATIGDVSTLNAGTGSVGNALSNGSGTKPTTVVAALNNIDATLGQIHGLKAGNSDLKANSNLADGTTVEQHLVALDNAIGNRTYTSTNQVAAGSSVAVAVSALDKAIGANVNGTNGNIKSDKSVNENLDLIDAVVGNRNIVSLNKALNESVKNEDFARAFKTTGNLIGDMAFDNTAYLVGQTDLSGAVRALDGNLHRVENEMQTIKREAQSGLAAVTAMSALVPNARDCGDTQISVGTGSYQDKFGIAAGAFHYVNDHVLLNAGASYGGHEQWAFRAGVTFGL